ncbi:MAG: hypothetical protein B7Y12_01960 [Rhizobiales bacterium 24-66-13]|nr:MAG: hypothetical protein B7Z41_03830 [Rhizobiales bacterium 12-66-7]OYY88787.1 MAG: hypothetical protein B7Y61_00995 [Rhizobiales bacterium 35-66-30]OYZ82781.1 MAG: hypothetical protein B7Y12_01960 [Rhizobiales bacterium 24-66-13]OZB11814.1 MAG: hypothetical protein B7X67_01940 [Rhizobiales bacterium 39-66-18]HQS09516.1 hypothetical protein [Xanthobacteraceae bacterium]
MSALQLFFGAVPVPYTASWTGEDDFFLARCRYAAGQVAICQKESRGSGKPLFGKPHMTRQREVISKGLCDLCGRTLKNSTKVSLSHARPQAKGARALDILQVEPLLHHLCAAISARHCPSLKRDIAQGAIQIRQVTRHQVQIALMDEIAAMEFTGIAHPGAAGHAKVQLLAWKDRDLAWLTGGEG